MSVRSEFVKAIIASCVTEAKVDGDTVKIVDPFTGKAEFEGSPNALLISVTLTDFKNRDALVAVRAAGKALLEREFPAELGAVPSYGVGNVGRDSGAVFFAIVTPADGVNFQTLSTKAIKVYEAVTSGAFIPPTRMDRAVAAVKKFLPSLTR